MNPADSPPPSWYQPPSDTGPEEWTVACPTCELPHEWNGGTVRLYCQCGHTITDAEALRARPEKEERE